MQLESCQPKRGTYAWIRSWEVPETSFFLSVPQEDAGKREGTYLTDGLVPLALGMFGFVSGGVDPGEDPKTAVLREALEEQGIQVSPNRVHNTLPPIRVLQYRHGMNCVFAVHGHSMHLTGSELERLYNSTPIIAVKDEALERFLRDERENLRPSVHLAGTRILHSGVLQRI